MRIATPLVYVFAACTTAGAAIADIRPIGAYNPPYGKDFSGISAADVYAGPVRLQVAAPLGLCRPGETIRTFRVDLYDIAGTQTYALGGSTSGSQAYASSMPGIAVTAASRQTGWLYRHFLDGTLSDYVSSYSDTADGNAALQQAIWYAEGNWIDAQGRSASLRGTALNLWYAASAYAGAGDVVDIASAGSPVASGLYTALPEHEFLIPAYAGYAAMPVVPVPAAAVLGLCGLSLVGWIRKRVDNVADVD